MGNEIILPTDDRAAEYRTNIKGWVSRLGHFYGEDEHLARYDGSTHNTCKNCGEPCEKHWLICDKCRDKKEIEKYHAMPTKEWNGTDGLYSNSHDRWFWSWDELLDYCHDEDCTYDDLMLVIGEPTYATEIDPSEHYSDDLPEDGELPDDLRKPFDDLNEFIRNNNIILSWVPSRFAAIIHGTPTGKIEP